jgi:hypothetical protein
VEALVCPLTRNDSVSRAIRAAPHACLGEVGFRFRSWEFKLLSSHKLRESLFRGASMDEAHVDALARQLARGAVISLAPDELPLFDDLNREYHRVGDKMVDTPSRDEPVGFGLELTLVTPYVLMTATVVAKFLVSSLLDAVSEETKASLRKMIGRLLDPGSRAQESVPGEPEVADPALRARIRAVADDRARAFGLKGQDAGLLADAILGALMVPPVQR